ncbi:MAG: hypothetical protein KC445_02730 [Anaerolineales bacterium]|nr:hypothetical protein [Anaerolineales bacterium]
MKNNRFIIIGLIIVIVLLLGNRWFIPGQSTLANAPTALSSTPTPFSSGGSDEEPPADFVLRGDAVAALATPVPGETQVYFIPTDNDATATVLYLYNTDTVAHIVALRGYSYNGVLVYSLNINVGATSFLRLSSDSIAAAPPPSWATPAPIITNFTDFTYFASLSLPKGVKVEGYVLFNPGTGVVDPRQDQGAIPLRFSTDPPTLFLPNVQNNH